MPAYFDFSAALATVSPAEDTSLPTPSTVLQAAISSVPASAAQASKVRIEFLHLPWLRDGSFNAVLVETFRLRAGSLLRRDEDGDVGRTK